MFVLEQICRYATSDPDRVAVVFNGEPVGYGALWRSIARRRQALAPHVPAGGIAVIRIENLLECWIFILALRSLGLDTACIQRPDQAEMFRGLDVAFVLSLAAESDADLSAACGVKHLLVGRLALDADSAAPEWPDDVRQGGHIKFTSGTTGRYKMTATNFGAARGPIDGRLKRYAAFGDRIVPFDGPVVFNLMNMGPWTSGGFNWPIFLWATGKTLILQQSDDLSPSFAWPGVTHMMATPWHLARLLELPASAFAPAPGLQLIAVSGAMSPALAAQVRRRLTSRIMINLSSTEIGAWAWSLCETDDDLRWHHLESDREVEVVDEAGERLSPGQIGTVRIRLRSSDPTEYVGDPETSAAVFVDGWYYPGDLGMFDEAGRLALCGRATDVIQIKGEKHPAEPWERAMRERLGCEAVCILSASGPGGAEDLYVFIESRGPIAPEALAEAARAILVGFPDCRIQRVERLPRTENGKIRRVALVRMLSRGVFDFAPARQA